MEVLVGQGLRFASVLGTSPYFLTKSFPKLVRYSWCTTSKFGKFDLSERYSCNRILSYNYSSCLNPFTVCKLPFNNQNVSINGAVLARYCTSQPPLKEDEKESKKAAEKNVSLYQKMKQMAKDYWYILIPVHLVTSAGWIAAFYMTAKNGVDIASIMEYMHLNEKYIETIRNSSAGNWALAYLLYKIFTPIRYTVTLGGTTMVIGTLSKRGLLKASELKKGIQEHRELKKTSSSTKSTGEAKSDSKTERPDSQKS